MPIGAYPRVTVNDSAT